MQKIFNFILAKSIGLYINILSFICPNKAKELARAFLTQPRRGKLKSNQLPEVLQQATIDFFQYDHHSFPVYQWQGNDTVVLLVHGWESNASRWENILPHLKASGSTVIAIDAPAHGMASGVEFSIPQYADFIHQTVQQYQPKYLVGHSVGGKTCLYYQHTYPNNTIEKIVVLGAPSDFKILFENYIRLLSLNNWVYQTLESECVAFYQKPLEEFSARNFAASISVNGLILHDTTDDVVSIQEAKKIASSWKNSLYKETEGLGHSMQDEKVFQEVTSFLFGSRPS